MTTGYLHPQYAASLAEFGKPRKLPASGGWILERAISGLPYRDAMGCYPLFSCRDWQGLGNDLKTLENKLVSLALVTNPFGDFTVDQLQANFDVCIRFKEHYVTDLSKPFKMSVHKDHRYKARKALRDVSIERCDNPQEYLLEWVNLYEHLISRHKITGIRAFSKEAFRQLLQVPGVELFIARHKNEIIGAQIWLVQDKIGYVHLTAMNQLGYKFSASYALRWIAMSYFADQLEWIDHGAGTGLKQNEDGLTRFKKRWASETRPTYFCGRILDQEKYDEICRKTGLTNTDYFPAYRDGEFA